MYHCHEAAHYHFKQSQQASSIPTWSSGGSGWLALASRDLDKAEAQFFAELERNTQTHSTITLLDNLAGIAYVSALKGQLEHALELIALILAHRATAYESKERIRLLREELLAELPAEVANVSEARGREMDLWETAESLLAD